MSALSKVIQLLPSLTSDELAKASQAIAAMQSMTKNGAPNVTEKAGSLEHWIMDQLVRVLASHGQPAAQVWAMERSASMLSQLRTKGADLQKFCQKVSGLRLEQTRLLQIALGLLYEDLREYGVPVTAAVLVRHLHRLPATIDKHFPGYAESGLLRFVIERRSHVRQKPTDEAGSGRRGNIAVGGGESLADHSG